MTTRYRHPELRKLLAGEYVLGSLQGAARKRFERLMAADPALRAQVERLAARLAPLATALAPEAPPAAVWQRVERHLGFARPAAQRAGLLARLRTLGMGWAVAGVVAGLMVGQMLPREQVQQTAQGDAQLPPSYVGVLADREGRAGMLVSSLRHGRVVDVKLLRPDSAPAGQTFFLWALPADGGAAIALGAIPPGQKVHLSMRDTSEALLSKATRLGVTAEPAGSAPAAPTEPYLYLGFCGKFWM